MKVILKDRDTVDELKKEIREARDGRYQLRLRAILMAKQGVKPVDIVDELLISIPTYYSWIHKYNNGGKESLKKHGSGRATGNTKFKQSIFDELLKKLDDMTEYWSVAKMKEFIKEEYGVNIHNETIRIRLKKVGYSYKSSRPSPYKGDKEKQEEFKKTALKRWSKN